VPTYQYLPASLLWMNMAQLSVHVETLLVAMDGTVQTQHEQPALPVRSYNRTSASAKAARGVGSKAPAPLQPMEHFSIYPTSILRPVYSMHHDPNAWITYVKKVGDHVASVARYRLPPKAPATDVPPPMPACNGWNSIHQRPDARHWSNGFRLKFRLPGSRDGFVAQRLRVRFARELDRDADGDVCATSTPFYVTWRKLDHETKRKRGYGVAGA
jgi:hypothetical protein